MNQAQIRMYVVGALLSLSCLDMYKEIMANLIVYRGTQPCEIYSMVAELIQELY
jgi:hypothetical protein